MILILDIILGQIPEKKVVSAEGGYVTTKNGVVTTGWGKPKPEPLFPLIYELLFKEIDEKGTREMQTDRKVIRAG